MQPRAAGQQMHPPGLLPLSEPLVPEPIWIPAVVLGSTRPFSMRDMTARATLCYMVHSIAHYTVHYIVLT